MELDESRILRLVENIAKFSDDSQLICTNWIEAGRQLTLSFLASSQPSALYAIIHGESYSIASDLINASTEFDFLVVMIKQAGNIKPNSSISSQIHVMNIPGTSKHVHLNQEPTNGDTNEDVEKEALGGSQRDPYGQIMNLVSLAVEPYFDYVSQNEGTDLSSAPINIAKKKLSELALSLRHLQHQIQVPELLVAVPQHIRDILANPDSPQDPAVISNSELLNDLTKIVNSWISQIQNVSQMSKAVAEETSLQDEVQLWAVLEATLTSVRDQTVQPEVTCAINILNVARRFQVTLAFQNNLGIIESLEQTRSYNELLKDLPLAELTVKKVSAENGTSSIGHLETTVGTFFSHLKRWKGSASLPLLRLVALVELILREIAKKLLGLLVSMDLVGTPYATFSEICAHHLPDLFSTIEINVKAMVNIARELMRKRQDKFMAIKMESDLLSAISDRIDGLKSLRGEYEELLQVLTRLEGAESLVQRVSLAFSKQIAPIDPFDFSKQGRSLWKINEKLYRDALYKVSAHMSIAINQRFEQSGTFLEYSSLFGKLLGELGANASKFVISFVEDRHKLKILDAAFLDIDRLLRVSSPATEGPTSTAIFNQILWETSLNTRLSFYLRNLELILGEAWESYSVGSKIKSSISSYSQTSSPGKLITEWASIATSILKNPHKTSNVLIIEEGDESHPKKLAVGADASITSVLHQGDILMNMGFEISPGLWGQFDRHREIQAITYSLIEHVSLLEYLLSDVLSSTNYGIRFGFLLEKEIVDVLARLSALQGIAWISINQEVAARKDSENLTNTSLVTKNLDQIYAFQDEVENLNSRTNAIHKMYEKLYVSHIPRLTLCAYTSSEIELIIKDIQDDVSHFTRSKLSHLDRFVAIVNQDILDDIAEKCRAELESLSSLILGKSSMSTASLEISPRSHAIVLERDTLVVVPPLETSKQAWVECVNGALELTEHMTSILATDNTRECEPFVSENLMFAINRVMMSLEVAYNKACDHLSKWQFLQNLLEDENSLQTTRFPTDMAAEDCLKSAQEILELGHLLDDQNGCFKVNDMMVISFIGIRNLVSQKFTVLRTNVLQILTQRSRMSSKKCLDELLSAQKLLSAGINTEGSTELVLKSVSDVYSISDSLSSWSELVKSLARCQSFLSRHNVHTSTDWIHVEHLESQIQNVKGLLEKSLASISSNFESIHLKLSSQWSNVRDAFKLLSDEWQNNKPISADLSPSSALVGIAKYKSRARILNDKAQALRNIAVFMEVELDDRGFSSLVETDIDELSFVWNTLKTLWEDLDSLKSQGWDVAHVGDIKHHLETIILHSNECPIGVRQYSAFSNLQSSVKKNLLKIPLLTELKSGAVKKRHWKKLFDSVGYTFKIDQSIRVGDVFNVVNQIDQNVVRDILEKANGEQLIQESLDFIKNEWSNIIFETFNHAGKCRLIKNWNMLFEQCASNLSTLASIRNSAFNEEFEAERDELENRLNDFSNLMNIWVDVQRQWVYLDGVFGSDNEIKAFLPLESSRFGNISFEFLTFLKKVGTFKLAIDVLSIKTIPATMKKLSDSLKRTIKGLTDFLDKQRDYFPRFHFIGNEDLLELLGGGHNEAQINKHIKRMFPGVASISINKELLRIEEMRSPEGEVVHLQSPVSLRENRSLVQWLTVFETEMKLTISSNIGMAVERVGEALLGHEFSLKTLESLMHEFPHQILIVALQVHFTSKVNDALKKNDFKDTIEFYKTLMLALASLTSGSMDTVFSSKVRCLIVESMHHEELVGKLADAESALQLSLWNSEQTFHWSKKVEDPLNKLSIKQGRFEFSYGYEYLGVVDCLANTPLVGECFLAMTQALAQKLGGSPFGPAGTGKTECVKALGHNLGRMVLVFCCDESFDFQSMGRILLGICKVGCWGCFDEFNRLEPKILSSLSTQIERIESSLQQAEATIVSGKEISVSPETGIFITMNPDYVGRNQLPENLKKLFRGFAMNKPDKEKIVDTILKSHGFSYSEELAGDITPFFATVEESLSSQRHYDFGLRALKSILNKAAEFRNGTNLAQDADSRTAERSIISKSLAETIGPKLVKKDEVIFERLLREGGFHAAYESEDDVRFLKEFNRLATSMGLDVTPDYSRKALQVFQIQQSHHGFMLVGSAGSGKSTICDLVLSTMKLIDSQAFNKFTIDCKVLTKDKIYGALDPITRDWTDGVLTKIIREVSASIKGESEKRTWIVFDGDIDPEWAENLNSLLDDNKLLTLPNGERLELPSNVKIVFEVSSLDNATPATVSRCAMIWFDEALFDLGSLWDRHIYLFRQSSDFMLDREEWSRSTKGHRLIEEIADRISGSSSRKFFEECYEYAKQFNHIMDYSQHRVLTSCFVFFKIHISEMLSFFETHIEIENLEAFVAKALALSLIWAFSGDCERNDKENLRNFLASSSRFSELQIPDDVSHCKISFPNFEWESWASPDLHSDLEPHQVMDSGTIVPTVDTVMHEALIHGIINKHSPLILCGPPGSGKTMTLFKALRSSSNLEVVPMNFSKDTTPETLLTTLEQHCEYKTTGQGLELSPKVEGKWAVVFCDEINLPSMDQYGTQRVISFMRQLVEQSGFWRPSDLSWVGIRNIQFVGACNDPNDPGRNRLSPRFLRHATLVMVDYPGPLALKQIYSSFNDASLKMAPEIRPYADALTNSMIEVYDSTRAHLTTKKQAHYLYSPRELTRWCRGILETLMEVQYSSLSDLLRLWYHEGLRLFFDRLVDQDEKSWCVDLFWATAARNFPNTKLDIALKGPVLFSTWLTGQYESVTEGSLTTFVSERLRVFSEEEMQYDLILFEDLLDHALRIDRVLRQHQGHMILVGPSTSGKTCLTKFVTWMNGMKLAQLKVHSKFSITEFENSLRDVLTSCAKGEKICFLIDESSILEASFIERMNSLLANSEIPGLFEGENLETLLKLCASEASARGLLLDSTDEVYAWFTKQISENLHVIFTMSELQNGNSPQINSSPALFNRCVMSWMGDWSDNSLKKVAETFFSGIPLDRSDFVVPSDYAPFVKAPLASFRDIVIDVFVSIHRSNFRVTSGVVPKRFLDFVKQFKDLFTRGQFDLEENQRHTNIGLDKLRETVLEVSQMKKLLSEKQSILSRKDDEAKLMLNQMILDQNESERKREFSVATKAELEKQEVEIEKRRTIVMNDLELAEPAVLQAQRGVQNIKKQHLTELRSMSNPPAAIKLAMESVCVLLSYKVSSWRDVQLIIRQDDFIAKIVQFDNETQLYPELRTRMKEIYLSRPDYNYEAINRASKACGPLLLWVIAQIRYSEILVKIGPLREQVDALEGYALKSKAKLIAIAEMIQELEESIDKYKNEYSEVIREAEKIKTEMSDIKEKVDRSMKLIENLTKERQRWVESSKEFEQERGCLVGNAILGSAFSVYCGNLDQKSRREMKVHWIARLGQAEIPLKRSLVLTSLLSTNSERISWSTCGLPDDDLFFENFAIKTRSDVPLIVDPTGDILPVLEKSSGRKLIVTSFLDESFRRTVEDALKFGGSVLIGDAEFYDPILDSVLRRDITRMGGRNVTRLGSKSIILSDSFEMILYTRDSRIVVSQFLKARVTSLNFTITRNNLENRVSNMSLQYFRPELNQKRIELQALQGEYSFRLLELKKLLLSTLNETSGALLDNDDAINSLEAIESETSKIDGQMIESEETMSSVIAERLTYKTFASHSKNIFDITMAIGASNPFYNFSFAGFLKIFKQVLKEKSISTNPELLISALYDGVSRFYSPTLRSVDKLLLHICLAVSCHSVEFGSGMANALIQALGSVAAHGKDNLESSGGKSVTEHWSQLREQHKDDAAFEKIRDSLGQIFDMNTAQNKRLAIEGYVSATFGGSLTRELSLEDWIQNVSGPLMFSTSESQDVSYQIQECAKFSKKKLVSIAMGAKEGIKEANEALSSASKEGFWLLIQNIQMSIPWLTHLKSMLQSKHFHEGFKLFMTCSLDATGVPNDLIGMSNVYTIEKQAPWKTTLLDKFNSVVLENSSLLESQILFLLSWYHAIIQERLRYVPISFQKSYDINDSDVIAAAFTVRRILEGSKGIVEDKESLWTEIAYRVGKIIYAGKIPIKEDAIYCAQLASQLFNANWTKPGFNLIANKYTEELGMTLSFPEASTSAEFRTWIAGLPDEVSLEWVGLQSEVSSEAREEDTKTVCAHAVEILKSAL